MLRPVVTGYILRRLWQSVLVLFAVSLLSFVLIFLSGDPVAALVPLNARVEDMDNIRHQYGLDQPILAQYVLFVTRAFSGDLGESFRYRTAALPLVLGRLPTTLLLACASVLLSTAISLPLGVLAAARRGSGSFSRGLPQCCARSGTVARLRGDSVIRAVSVVQAERFQEMSMWLLAQFRDLRRRVGQAPRGGTFSRLGHACVWPLRGKVRLGTDLLTVGATSCVLNISFRPRSRFRR